MNKGPETALNGFVEDSVRPAWVGGQGRGRRAQESHLHNFHGDRPCPCIFVRWHGAMDK